MHIPTLTLLLPLPLLLSATPLTPDTNTQTCDCTGTTPAAPTTPQSICNDPRLGPVKLPSKLPLYAFVDNYDRFGGLTPGAFLSRWTNTTTGFYNYPPASGFSLDDSGNPISGNMTLEVGTKVDRFGYESGSYISAADAPFNQRSLPPSSLNTDAQGMFPLNYRIYRVSKRLPVVGGPIAPWFGQPGLGAQFFTGGIGNVSSLVSMGYLERLEMSDIVPAGSRVGGCGQ